LRSSLKGDVALVVAALGDIARARGMSQFVREASLGREAVDKKIEPVKIIPGE